MTRFLGLLAVLLAALALAACGGAEPTPPTTTAPAATTTDRWTFTDDRDVEVSLAATPVRIVAEADSARALYDLGITPVGIFGSAPLDQLPHLDGMPLDEIESLGTTYGEVNVEALAALEPDLIVTTVWPPEPLVWGVKDMALQQQLTEVAPLVAVDSRANARHGIGRFEELASSLGADLSAAPVQKAKERFEAAEAALSEAVAAKPDLRVLAVSGGADTLYVAKPANYADLALYLELGVPIVTPDVDDAYWQELSWEEAGRYPADVMFIDARVFAEGNPEDAFAGVPTWNALPAVKAGQTGAWRAGPPLTNAGYAPNLEELAALIESADVVAR